MTLTRRLDGYDVKLKEPRKSYTFSLNVSVRETYLSKVWKRTGTFSTK